MEWRREVGEEPEDQERKEPVEAKRVEVSDDEISEIEDEADHFLKERVLEQESDELEPQQVQKGEWELSEVTEEQIAEIEERAREFSSELEAQGVLTGHEATGHVAQDAGTEGLEDEKLATSGEQGREPVAKSEGEDLEEPGRTDKPRELPGEEAGSKLLEGEIDTSEMERPSVAGDVGKEGKTRSPSDGELVDVGQTRETQATERKLMEAGDEPGLSREPSSVPRAEVEPRQESTEDRMLIPSLPEGEVNGVNPDVLELPLNQAGEFRTRKMDLRTLTRELEELKEEENKLTKKTGEGLAEDSQGWPEESGGLVLDPEVARRLVELKQMETAAGHRPFTDDMLHDLSSRIEGLSDKNAVEVLEKIDEIVKMEYIRGKAMEATLRNLEGLSAEQMKGLLEAYKGVVSEFELDRRAQVAGSKGFWHYYEKLRDQDVSFEDALASIDGERKFYWTNKAGVLQIPGWLREHWGGGDYARVRVGKDEYFAIPDGYGRITVSDLGEDRLLNTEVEGLGLGGLIDSVRPRGWSIELIGEGENGRLRIEVEGISWEAEISTVRPRAAKGTIVVETRFGSGVMGFSTKKEAYILLGKGEEFHLRRVSDVAVFPSQEGGSILKLSTDYGLVKARVKGGEVLHVEEPIKRSLESDTRRKGVKFFFDPDTGKMGVADWILEEENVHRRNVLQGEAGEELVANHWKSFLKLEDSPMVNGELEEYIPKGEKEKWPFEFKLEGLGGQTRIIEPDGLARTEADEWIVVDVKTTTLEWKHFLRDFLKSKHVDDMQKYLKSVTLKDGWDARSPRRGLILVLLVDGESGLVTGVKSRWVGKP